MLAQVVVATLIVISAIGGLGSITLIGRERKPITPGLALFLVVYNAVWVVALAHVYFQL